MILNTLIFYVLYASSVLIYGIGINRIVNIGFNNKYSIVYYVKMILDIVSSSVLGWLVTKYVLLPMGLIEIFPIIVFLIYVSISAFIEAIVRITTNTSAAEFTLSFIIIILSILESTSLLNTLLICFCCILEIILLVPFLIAFKKRVNPNETEINERYYGLFFVFLAVMVIILTVWDLVSINTGIILS